MKKRTGRMAALLLCLLLAVSTPVSALAESTDSDGTAQSESVDTLSEEDGTDADSETDADVDDAGSETDTDADGTGSESDADADSDVIDTESTDSDSTDGSDDTDSGSSDSDSTDSGDTDDDSEEEETVDKSALETQITKASSLTESKYKPSTWKTLSSALTAAKEVYNSDSATQTQVDSATATLKEAISDLVKLKSTKYTYKLKRTEVKTTTVSSGDLKKISVPKPYLVTTTTKTWSDGTTTTSTKTTAYGLTVKVYVRGVGWKKASLNSAGTYYTYTASSASSGKFITAIKITPSSNFKSKLSSIGYTVIYRAKVETFGTLGWAKLSQKAGTTGNNLTLKSVTLKFLKSSTAKSSSYDYDDNYISKPVVTYKTKTTGSSSYSSAVTNGSTSGTTSSGSSIGALAIKLTGSSRFSGSIQYSIRTSTSDSSSNWSSYKKNYAGAGSKSSKIKAIKVKLTGDMADNYDVYYRVYISGYGWLGWAKNGQKAGIYGANYNISAIQVKLVTKGADAPGGTSNRYISASSSAKLKMIMKAQSFSSGTKYLILVDRANCKVGIFSGSKNNWTLKYYWSCCVGKASTPTISGTYTQSGYKAYSFGESKGYSCYYATQISGNYLFHSVLYYPYSSTIKDGTMGQAVSHGCVRLTKSHAYWIYCNIGKGTTIHIY